MKRVLVADTSDGLRRAREALAGFYTLRFASTLSAAQQLLEEESFDVVVMGVQFDECQMFPLVQLLRTNDRVSRTPFLVVRDTHSLTGDNAEKVAQLLGACKIVHTGSLPAEQANAQLRAAIEHCLNPPKKKAS